MLVSGRVDTLDPFFEHSPYKSSHLSANDNATSSQVNIYDSAEEPPSFAEVNAYTLATCP